MFYDVRRSEPRHGAISVDRVALCSIVSVRQQTATAGPVYHSVHGLGSTSYHTFSLFSYLLAAENLNNFKYTMDQEM